MSTYARATLDKAYVETLANSDSLRTMGTLQQQMDGREEILASTVRLHELLQPQISNPTENEAALKELNKRRLAARDALRELALEEDLVVRSLKNIVDEEDGVVSSDQEALSDIALGAVRNWSDAVLRFEALESEESAKQSAGGASAETTGN